MHKKILIIEQIGATTAKLQRGLRHGGYGVLLASDMAQGLALFDDERPDMVVISLTLPESGGPIACRRIRGRPLGTLVPILYVGTGAEDIRNASDAIAAGADHFFEKPQGLDDLLANVRTYIGPGDGNAAVPRPKSATTSDDASPERMPIDAGAGPLSPVSPSVESERPPPPSTDAATERALWDSVSLALEQTIEVDPATLPDSPGTDQLEPTPADTLTESDWSELDDFMRGHKAPPEPKAPERSEVGELAAAVLEGGAQSSTREPPGSGGLHGRKTLSKVVLKPGQQREAGTTAVVEESRPGTVEYERSAPTLDVSGRAAAFTEAGADSGRERAEGRPDPSLSRQTPPLSSSRARPSGETWSAEARRQLHMGDPIELEQRGLAELLAHAIGAGLTGRVELATSGCLRRVFFDGGRPASVDSSDEREDLAAYLAEEGLVPRRTVDRARGRAKSDGRPVEELLVESDHVEPEALYGALRGCVIGRLLSWFALEAGEAVAYRGGPGPLDPVDLGMHPGRLIFDGLRRKYGRLRLFRVFGTPSVVPRHRVAGDRPRGLPAGMVLRSDEERLVGEIDGIRTVAQIAGVADVNPLEALAIIYGLVLIGVVEPPICGQADRTLPPLGVDGSGRGAAPRRPEDMPGFAELVDSKHAEARNADYFQVLGVPRSATGADIRSAWERLRRQFDPHRVRPGSPLRHQVDEIVLVVCDAYAMLSDEGRRARYLTNIERLD